MTIFPENEQNKRVDLGQNWDGNEQTIRAQIYRDLIAQYGRQHLYSIKIVAEVLDKSPSTLKRWLNEGRLKIRIVQMGKSFQVSPYALAEYLAGEIDDTTLFRPKITPITPPKNRNLRFREYKAIDSRTTTGTWQEQMGYVASRTLFEAAVLKRLTILVDSSQQKT